MSHDGRGWCWGPQRSDALSLRAGHCGCASRPTGATGLQSFDFSFGYINFYDICTSISLISLTCLQILPQFLVQSSHSMEVYKTEHKLSWLLCLQGQMTHLLLNSVGWSILHLSSNIYVAIHTHTHTHRKASWIKLMLYTPLLKQDRNWKLWCATFLKE